MANQPTKYRKFVVGAASAALVASAVAPVASAKDFSDTKGNTHEVAIDALSDAGIISGYQDGSFKPNQTLTRSDVVKLMGKWLVSLGYEVPEDYKTSPRFTDLTSATNDELLKYAAVVKDNGVFNGSNGRLLAGDNITRENMAVVLVRAFDTVNDINLVEYVEGQDDFKKEVTDRNSAKSEARTAIDVLDFFDVTTVAQFNPKGTTTRGHFATFLNNFLNADLSQVTGVVAGVESITAVNNTTVEVKFVNAVEDLAALDFAIEGLTISNKVIKQTDAKTVVLTTSAQTAGTVYTVTANGNKLGTFNGPSAVVPTGIKSLTPSLQGTIGKDVTVSAQVTVPEGQSKAGIPVTFNINSDSTTGALQNGKVEAVAYTNAEGVASYTYTRYYKDTDTVVAYATSKSSVSSTSKVYWNKSLSISEVTSSNALTNNAKKVYEVEGAAGQLLVVTFEEHIGVKTNELEDAEILDAIGYLDADGKYFTTKELTPYELSNGTAKYAVIELNKNGVARFTVSGVDASVTPVVYDKGLAWNGSKVEGKGAYSATALQAKASTVKFSVVHKLELDVKAEGREYANIATTLPARGDVLGDDVEDVNLGGRNYVVTAKDVDGKVAPKDTKAYLTFEKGNYKHLDDVRVIVGDKVYEADDFVEGVEGLELTGFDEGKKTFRIISDNVEAFAQPTVFFDTSSADDRPGAVLDKNDTQYEAEATFFEKLHADDVKEAVLTFLDKDDEEVESVRANEYVKVVYQAVDLNGFPYAPEKRYDVTFELSTNWGNIQVKDGSKLVNLGSTGKYTVLSTSENRGKAVLEFTADSSATVSVDISAANGILPAKASKFEFTTNDNIPSSLKNAVVTQIQTNNDRVKLENTNDQDTAWIKYTRSSTFIWSADGNDDTEEDFATRYVQNQSLTFEQFEEILDYVNADSNLELVVDFVKDKDGNHRFVVKEINDVTVTENTAPVNSGKTVELFFTDTESINIEDLATDADGDALSFVGNQVNSTNSSVATGTVSGGVLTVSSLAVEGSTTLSIDVTDGKANTPITVVVTVVDGSDTDLASADPSKVVDVDNAGTAITLVEGLTAGQLKAALTKPHADAVVQVLTGTTEVADSVAVVDTYTVKVTSADGATASYNLVVVAENSTALVSDDDSFVVTNGPDSIAVPADATVADLKAAVSALHPGATYTVLSATGGVAVADTAKLVNTMVVKVTAADTTTNVEYAITTP